MQERFANPNIKDSVARICSESSAKLPKFLIETLNENLAADGSIEFSAMVIAAWCYYSDKGVDRNGQAIDKIDAITLVQVTSYLFIKSQKDSKLTFP